MLLEANMLQRQNPLIPIQEIVEVNDGRAYLSHEIDKTKKSFYKIFEAENIQHQTKLKPISEEGKLVCFGNKELNTTIVADYYYKPKN
jgi:hypothetical protein